MTGTATVTKLQKILTLTHELSASERDRFKELITQAEALPLPECATIDEAIELYLAKVCGLGRAAELAGISRWRLIDELGERGLWTYAAGHETAEEIDQMAAQVRNESRLCSLSATQIS